MSKGSYRREASRESRAKKGRKLIAAKAAREFRLQLPKPQSGEREQEPDEVTEQQSCKVTKRPTAGGCESNSPGRRRGTGVPDRGEAVCGIRWLQCAAETTAW